MTSGSPPCDVTGQLTALFCRSETQLGEKASGGCTGAAGLYTQILHLEQRRVWDWVYPVFVLWGGETQRGACLQKRRLSKGGRLVSRIMTHKHSGTFRTLNAARQCLFRFLVVFKCGELWVCKVAAQCGGIVYLP